MTEAPHVLLVDDQPDTRELLRGPLAVSVLAPADSQFNEELQAQISKVDLVLIDQELKLDESEWLKAVDGAALVGNFRSHARKLKISLPPLVLITAYQEAYANEIPAVGPTVPLNGTFLRREHRLAPTLDVEWILAKDDTATPGKIVELAVASVAARHCIGSGGATLDEIEKFLELASAEPWAESGKEYVQRARPPVSMDTSSAEDHPRGPTTVLRWLLQRVLPYPGLMLSDLYAAWTLRVSYDSFLEFLRAATKTPWESAIFSAQYHGPLATFLGRRWWAAGIEHAAWQLHERANQTGNLQAAIDVLAPGSPLKALDLQDPVVVWTEDLIEQQIAPIDSAVQLHPPGWPAEAIEPWVLRSDVDADPILKSMLDPIDLSEKLGGSS